MSEVAGLVHLAAGMAALASGAALVCTCFRMRSPLEFVLATYLLAWGWLVAVVLALSPVGLVSRAWLTIGLTASLAAAFVAWLSFGRPRPPSFRPGLSEALTAIRGRPALLVLALPVAAGMLYSVALAFYTPANDGDALAYHLARAALWRQEHGLGYVDGAADLRINANPPNAEIGQLATMLLSANDRYVALPQLLAYAALLACVARLARVLDLSIAEALFGALMFATLPVVAIQASSALNDLVVASFLAAAAVFLVSQAGIAPALFALAVALALGTKLTTVLALPLLVLVAAFVRPRREWLRLGMAATGGVLAGSVWYLVNLAETGEFDGGLADAFDQRAQPSLAVVGTNALRLGLDLVDRSGAPQPHVLLFLVPTLALGVAGLVRARHCASAATALLAAAALTASVFLAGWTTDIGQRVVLKGWRVLGQPETAPFEKGWGLNTQADAVASWFGPLGFLCLSAGAVLVAVLAARKLVPAVAYAFVAAPWILLLALAGAIIWDPWRGRFLVFGVALAAATWGVFLRLPVAAWTSAALGVTTLMLSLTNHQGKPLGLHAVWPIQDPPPVSLDSIWDDRRYEAQARQRLGESERDLFRYFETSVPLDSEVAVVARVNDLLSPYFGSRLTREVTLVDPDGGLVPATAEWLVLSPHSRVRRCESAWQREVRLGTGFGVERRIAADACPL